MKTEQINLKANLHGKHFTSISSVFGFVGGELTNQSLLISHVKKRSRST